MENNNISGRSKGHIWAFISFLLFILFLFVIYDTPRFQDYVVKIKTSAGKYISSSDTVKESDSLLTVTFRNINFLEEKLSELQPDKSYIVINTTANRFSLRDLGGDTIRTGLCSTGKDEILYGKDRKPYVFRTPRGEFAVLNKRTDPVWVKPNWAFEEEGLAIPPARSVKRIDDITLGDYALGIGNGYFIHGTLYQRRLGVGETHGCVRIGDKDLEVIYKTLKVGSKVFIY